MTQYLLNIYQPDGPPPPPETLGPIMQQMAALEADLKASGAWVFSGGLTPPGSATVLRQEGAEVLLTDGPFVEGKEHLGGFIVIRAADLDAALSWARRLAGIVAPLSIEIRPFQGR